MSNYNILCVEDSEEFCLYLKSILSDYNLTFCSSLSETYQVLTKQHSKFDLILLDVSLPDGNGIKSIEKIKDFYGGSSPPIFILSHDNDILSKISAFGLGVDDYIHKPPIAAELNARVSAKLRSYKSQQKRMDKIVIGDLTVNISDISIHKDLGNGKQESLDLTPLEFKVFKVLVTRPDQVFSRDQIIDMVWGNGKYITDRAIDAHISHIRKKIESSTVSIETVLGVGYKIKIQNL